MTNTQNKHFTYWIIALISAVLLLANPVMAMTTLDNKTTDIATLTGKGKWTVFKVWAHDCHVCRQTIHYLSDFEIQYPDADVYGICIDGRENLSQIQRFIDEFSLDFPNLVSDAAEVSEILYAQAGETLVGTPTLIVYQPDGKLSAVQPGPVPSEDLIRYIERENKRLANNQ